MQIYVKGLYAALVGGLGALSGALAVLDGVAISDLPDAVWVTVALFSLAGFGGILGWQAAPRTMSISVRSPDAD
jgi:hypothetical protein